MLPFYTNVPGQLNSHAPAGLLPLQQGAGNNTNNFTPYMTQLHPQLGYMNSQIPAPLTCPNPNAASLNMANPLQGLINLPNQIGHMGKSILGMAPPNMMPHVQTLPGFGPPNSNAVPGFPLNGQFGAFSTNNLNGLNQYHCPGQFLAHVNAVNSLNQNGQLGWQNQLLNVPAQFVNLPLLNPAPASPFGPPMPCANQLAQGMVPRNNAFVSSQQSALVQNTGALQQNCLSPNISIQHRMDVNALRQHPSSMQQPQMKFPSPSISASSITQRNATTSLSQQNDSVVKDGMRVAASDNAQSEIFRTYPKQYASDQRFQKSQNHRLQNMRGNQMFVNHNRVKGNMFDGGRKSGPGDIGNQSKCGKKRSLISSYTDKEIQQWREERKKHYPSKMNIEKKHADRQNNPEAMDSDDKLRRQQLKDVLAKQVELGFEVPEIPPHYLSDSEEVEGHKRRPFNKMDKFQNRHNNLGRLKEKGVSGRKRPFGENKLSTKRQRENSDAPSQTPCGSREPTLLQKLLSADIKRDKSCLLQAFRFMVMNSFLNDWPEKPLKFPEVILKEAESEDEVIEGALCTLQQEAS